MTTSRVISKIEELIPQRSPIIMVDELVRVDGDECLCQLTIREDNYFLLPDKTLTETGVIEHMAQSASAFAGYRTMLDGASCPPVGYIGEVKHFHIHRRPRLNDTLHTSIAMGLTIGGVTMVSASTRCGDELIAETQMKIFLPEVN